MSNKQEYCHYCSGALRVWKGGNFSFCQNCRLIMRNNSIAFDNLNQLYKKSWETPYLRTEETGGTDLRLARFFVRRLVKSLGTIDIAGLKILDFGAGRGAMMIALKEFGADPVAVEPYGDNFLHKQNLIAYRKLDELPDGILFDGIVSIDVIEHLTAPWEDILALKKVLKPSAWMFLTTANCEGLNARIYGRRWREAQTAGHVYLFSPYTIEKILADLGFRQTKRLNWFIPYSTNPLIQLKDNILRIFKIDGELRYLAYND